MRLEPARVRVIVLFLRQHHDAASLGRFVGQRSELRRVGEFVVETPGAGDELARLAIAQRDGAGFVEEEDIDIARRFHRPAAHREHVTLKQPIHARDADRR